MTSTAALPYPLARDASNFVVRIAPASAAKLHRLRQLRPLQRIVGRRLTACAPAPMSDSLVDDSSKRP
jgi:hypothetical protein